EAAFRFGTRWVTRHQNMELGVELLQEAFAADPSKEAAFTFLREIWGTKEGNWERVLELLDKAQSQGTSNGSETFILAQAATLTWRQLGNLMRARGYFERLSAVSPDHPSLQAFEKQIGEPVRPRDGAVKPATPAPPPVAAKAAAKAQAAAPPPEPSPEPPPVAAKAAPAPAAAAASEESADDAKISELRAL